MKYKEWLMNWLANYVMPNYKNRTCTRYTNIVTQHIIPKLGEYELSELTPFIVQQFVTELSNHGNLKTGKGLASNCRKFHHYRSSAVDGNGASSEVCGYV